MVDATREFDNGVGDVLLKLGVSESVCEKPKLDELIEDWLNLRHDARNATELMLRADRNLLFVDPVEIGLESGDIHFRDFDDASRPLVPFVTRQRLEELRFFCEQSLRDSEHGSVFSLVWVGDDDQVVGEVGGTDEDVNIGEDTRAKNQGRTLEGKTL